MLETILGFLPWILLKIVSYFSLPQAIVVALICSLLSYPKLRKGFILAWGTFLFFLVSFLFIVLLKEQWFFQYMGIFSSLALAIITWVSFLVNCPFTLQYAKLKIPKKQWSSPVFIQINKIMTSAFGVLFILSTFLEIYCFFYPEIGSALSWGSFCFTVLFVFFFPSWFPKWYKKRKKNLESKIGWKF